MKKFSIILVLLALAAALYIWHVQTSGETDIVPEPETVSNTVGTSTPIESEETVLTPEEVQEETEPETTVEEPEPIIIETDVLSTEQTELLQTFGIDTEAIEVTADMIACAEEKVGKERLDAITKGDLPSFFEGVSLATCYGQ